MKTTQRYLAASAIGVGLLAALLVLVYLDSLVSAEPPETVALREIRFRQPPPPPPPPVTRQDQVDDPRPELSEARRTVPLELTTMELDIKIPAGELGGEGSGWSAGIGIDLGTVELDGLDEIPSVIRAPVIDDYPMALADQGYDALKVKLHISIDERGRPYLIEVLETNYPPYNPKLAEFVSQVRFTPPTLLGVPVRTEFAWPLLIPQP